MYLPPQGEAGLSSADMAYQQKAMAMIATTSPDIYITDSPTFMWLSNGGAFSASTTWRTANLRVS
ncbi:hypothetical protein HMSSN139_27070 [Paenibacillus sp. HMSSN-139]|nr:hypothetical protein HMSSN139_27070 [Paenibacillus sp. HMSSN-139]